jgi:hypothetical protein
MDVTVRDCLSRCLAAVHTDALITNDQIRGRCFAALHRSFETGVAAFAADLHAGWDRLLGCVTARTQGQLSPAADIPVAVLTAASCQERK